MKKFEKDMFYVTRASKLSRLACDNLKTIDMIYEKKLFDGDETAEKIIIILQYVDNYTFKEILTHTQIKVEPESDLKEMIIKGNEFNEIYEGFNENVLFVDSNDLKPMTQLDKYEFSKMNQTIIKQLMIKTDRISKQQFTNEVKEARISSDEYVIITSGKNLFGNMTKNKNNLY